MEQNKNDKSVINQETNIEGGSGLDYKSKTEKQRFGILKVAAGIIGILAIGTIIFYFISKQEPARKAETPQQIIKSSLEATSKAKTYAFDGNMKADALIKPKLTDDYQSSYPQDLNFTYNIAVSGKEDQTDINNPKASINMKLDMDFSGEGGNQKFYFDLDAVSIGKKAAYYKLNEYDLGMVGIMIGPQISQYKGKWYKLDMEEMNKSADDNPMYNSFSMSDYDINKIKKLYERYELMKFQKDLGNTKLGNIDVYHYRLKLDGMALANFYMDLLKEAEPENKNEISKKSFEEMLQEFKDGIEKYKNLIDKVANNINVEVWIGKNDRLMYKVKANGKFDKKFLEMVEEEIISKEEILNSEMPEDSRPSKSLDDLEISFDTYFNMSDFNKPVSVEEPKEAESLLKVFEKISGDSFSPYENTITSSSDSDNDGLTDDMEKFYGTDKNNSDTDGDGHKDGEEVNSGYDPLLPGDAKLDYEKLFNKK